jgi:hypothetical protein
VAFMTTGLPGCCRLDVRCQQVNVPFQGGFRTTGQEQIAGS